MGRTRAEAWSELQGKMTRLGFAAADIPPLLTLFADLLGNKWATSTVLTQLSRANGPGCALVNDIGRVFVERGHLAEWVDADPDPKAKPGPRGPRKAREHADALNTVVALLDRHGVGNAGQALGYRLVLLNERLEREAS